MDQIIMRLAYMKPFVLYPGGIQKMYQDCN